MEPETTRTDVHFGETRQYSHLEIQGFADEAVDDEDITHARRFSSKGYCGSVRPRSCICRLLVMAYLLGLCSGIYLARRFASSLCGPTITDCATATYVCDKSNGGNQQSEESGSVVPNEEVKEEGDSMVESQGRTTFFRDPSCPAELTFQSTRHISDYRVDEPILYWIGIYTAHNAPKPPERESVFDDPPKSEPNTGHVSFLEKPSSTLSRMQNPIILLLSSYQAMTWTIDPHPRLVRVIATGYQRQDVIFRTMDDSIASRISVELYSTENQKFNETEFPNLETVWPSSTSALQASASAVFADRLRNYRDCMENHTGTTVYAFDYCYYGSNAVIPL